LDIDHHIFISYSSIDKEVADKVCSILEENGISCWMAPRNITPGMSFAEAIIDGIKSAKVFVLIYSSNSNNSTQVIREVDRAVNNGLPIINLRLQDVPLSKQLEYYVSSVHWLDAITPPLEQHIHQLCNVVQMFLKPEKVKDVEIAEALREGVIKQNEPFRIGKRIHTAKRSTILVSGILLVVVIAIGFLIFLNIGGIREARAGSIGSIIVLPFENYTGIDSLEYFVSGMHSSLIQDMGKIGSLHIPGITTSKVYKNANKTIAQIIKEIKVDAALETDVLCFGEDSICVQSRLIKSGREEEQLWIADYKIPRNQIPNWYIGVTKQISKEINIKLTTEEARLLSKSRTVDRNSYDEYLKACSYWGDLSRESLNKALEYLNSAIKKDPGWAPLYAGLAQVWWMIEQMQWELPSVASPKIYENLNKALQLDPDFTDSHYLNAVTALWIEWNWEKSEKEFIRALAINPNDVYSRMFYAYLLCILQRTDEALTQGKMALDLDPLNPLMMCWYGQILVDLGDCKGGMTYAEKVLAVDPKHLAANNVLTVAAYQCKEYEKVFQADINYSFPVIIGEDALKGIEKIYHDQGFSAAYEELAHRIEKFATNKRELSFNVAYAYNYANKPDKTLDWLEKACEIHDPNMPMIATRMFNLDPLFDNPRFIKIVKKMNLPLPKD
jgi:TolB-like protein